MGTGLSRAVWRKSSYSNGSGGDCVQVALAIPEVVAVRDSKNPDGPQLIFSHEEWQAFIAALRAGELDSRPPLQPSQQDQHRAAGPGE